MSGQDYSLNQRSHLCHKKKNTIAITNTVPSLKGQTEIITFFIVYRVHCVISTFNGEIVK